MAKLTRDEMERVLREGGSVVHQGRVIAHVEHLPTKAELAQGDPEAEAQTAEEIDAEIAKLRAQKTQMAEAARQREAEAKKAKDGAEAKKGDEAQK